MTEQSQPSQVRDVPDDAMSNAMPAGSDGTGATAPPTHPATERAGQLLDGIAELPIDHHGERYEQAHAELQAALADAERPGRDGAR